MTGEKTQWPALPLEQWRDTYATLHLWTQIVGKVRLKQMPWTNHSWHVTLYLTSRGLTTSPIPFGDCTFQLEFDFLDQQLRLQRDDGRLRVIPLKPQSVAHFYRTLFAELAALGIDVKIYPKPNEIPDAIPFPEDETHRAYDPEYARRFWQVLSQTERVMKIFRARFIGKCSPVQYFWGSCDLAVTRFSGRPAPPHPGGIVNLPDWVTREAYSHEVSSCGFWPGGGPTPYPLFYAYAYPEPAGFADAPVRPRGASYNKDLREFILPYDEVRNAGSPDDALLEFLQSTYEAAANLGDWNRAALERSGPIK